MRQVLKASCSLLLILITLGNLMAGPVRENVEKSQSSESIQSQPADNEKKANPVLSENAAKSEKTVDDPTDEDDDRLDCLDPIDEDCLEMGVICLQIIGVLIEISDALKR